MIFLGFLGIILLGSFLLMLPIATRPEGHASFPDALFTAVSAVCVTGLVVQDTASYWTGFGQFIIIFLIQVGGMGVVTLTLMVLAVFQRKISLLQRSTMQEAIASSQVGGMVRITKFIFHAVFIIEGVAALLLLPVFVPRFGFLKGAWYAVFHSISAFCNAGFDLMGVPHPYSSLTDYAGDAWVNLVIMSLIVIGGLGFFVLKDLRVCGFRWKRYRLQSKMVIFTSFFLILIPALYFFFMEFPYFPRKERVLMSLFQAISPRTAGFNTADYRQFSGTGISITILLMLIGGSPGSTAGGMKTTTFLVLLLSMFSVMKREKSAEIFKRRIEDDIVRTAAALLLMYLFLFFFGAMILSTTEQLPMKHCLFETASAVGTVGLTMGITPMLHLPSRLVLIILMFLGRVGGLTLIFATVASKDLGNRKYPAERVAVG